MLKKTLKKTVLLVIDILVLPIVCPLVILSKSKVIEYKEISTLVSILPTELGNRMRWWFYKLTLEKVGRNFKIFWLSYVVYPTVEIGDNVTIEEKCVVSSCKIGNDVILAANVSIMSGKNHHGLDELDKTFYESKGSLKTVILEDNLWIGTHAVIMDDISSGTVVGAGSVVTKKFEKNAIVAGIPAKLIRKRGL